MQNIQKPWHWFALGAISGIIFVLIIVALVNGTNKPTSSNTSAGSSSKLVKNKVFQEQPSAAVGRYLTDPKGNTLYTSEKDKPGVSNCDSSCIKTWPPYGPSASESLPDSLTVIKRSDGSQQFAYKDQPLYYCHLDTAPGSILCNGLGGYHVAVY